MSTEWRRRAFVCVYAASGASGLIYEVTWTRLLTLHMGHTVAAASTVLAAFMGGLALGSWIGGRVEDSFWRVFQAAGSHRLRVYAALELIIALAAIVLPAILAAFVPVLAFAYDEGAAPARLAAVRVVLSLATLGVPATAMGATFPIAAGYVANVFPARGRNTSVNAAGDVGALYAANTAGAALGALAAGFWLVPAVGLRGATWTGVSLNLAAGAAALVLALASREEPASREELASRGELGAGRVRGRDRHRLRGATRHRSMPEPPLPSRDTNPLLACTVSAICGFVALVYEVAWTRLLALVIGPTTYAFATMVAIFISGLAIGAFAGARIVRRGLRPAIWLAGLLLFASVAASAGSWFAASRLPLVVASQVADPHVVFGRLVARQAFAVALLLLPMTCALGAAFPLALALAMGGRPGVGHEAARVYTSNTIGAIGGALIAGFALLPASGLHGTFRIANLIGFIGSLAVLATTLRTRRLAGRLAMTAAAFASSGAVVFLLPDWDLDLLASGAYKYAPYMQSGDLEAELRAGHLLYYKDGAVATVSVRQLAGTISLAIDGKIDASTGGDMLTQRLLGLLPVLLHSDAQDICVIGLGSGVTLGSALASGTVRRADVVEISPEVVEASTHFEKENGHALTAPGVRVIVGDGRSHLLLTTRRYDAIVSEPSNPWVAGISALFTREFFELARARLKPGGLMCQWAHTYDISADDLRSIVRTFGSVFPEATMWLVGEGDLLLIGTTGPAADSNIGRLAARVRSGTVPAVLNDSAIAEGSAPFALLSLYVGGPAELRRFAADALIQRDDRMALEFSAPRAIYGRATNENASVIRALLRPGSRPPVVEKTIEHATDVDWSVDGAMELKAEAFDSAYDRFRRAVTMNSRNVEALSGLSEAAAGAHRQDEELAWLQALVAAEGGNAAVRVELSRLFAARGDIQQAATLANDAIRLTPGDPRPGEQLASVLADAGDADRLAPLADALASRFPQRDKPRYYQATALFLHGRVPEAIERARQVVAGNPHDAHAQNLLGAACATAGLRDCAQAAFEASLLANPRDSATYINFGTFQMQSANPGAAAQSFAVALTLDPSSAPARSGFADARAAVASRQ